MKSEDITFVEQRLGYTFTDKSELIRALTRKAFAQEQKQQGRNCGDQEVYRILGDAILKAILVELLIERGYDSREKITNKKIDLEKRENLGAMLRDMEIAPFIRFGRGEQKQGISKQSSVLGETFEALIAAVHVDAGCYEITKDLIVELFDEQVAIVSAQTVLQESDTDSGINTVQKLWISLNSCGHCVQSDICANMMMCMFDVSDSD